MILFSCNSEFCDTCLIIGRTAEKLSNRDDLENRLWSSRLSYLYERVQHFKTKGIYTGGHKSPFSNFKQSILAILGTFRKYLRKNAIHHLKSLCGILRIRAESDSEKSHTSIESPVLELLVSVENLIMHHHGGSHAHWIRNVPLFLKPVWSLPW